VKLYYYQDDMHNFGDDLNEWLIPKFLSEVLDDNEEHLLIAIGTILNNKLPIAKQYTILGSGWGYGDIPKINNNWKIICVRGKTTCKALGLNNNLAIIDPAYLLRDLVSTPITKKYPISLIPHALSMEKGHWKEICDNLGIHLIDIRTKDIEDFVNQIRSSEKVLTEAMHGAIVSDAFGVPWLGYSAYTYINSDKWNDWLSVFNYSTTLFKINSLYKGYEDLSYSEKLKQELKHFLKFLGIWKSNWYPPINRKTSKKERKKICEQLKRLIDSDNYYLTNKNLIENQLVKLRRKIVILINEYKLAFIHNDKYYKEQ